MGGRSTRDPDGYDEHDAEDYPSTHLDDEAYEAFLERELDGKGRPRGTPPVGVIILVLIVILLAVAVVAFR